MYRDDYIMRMIRQLGTVIAYVAGLRRKNQYPLALIAIDNALRNQLGIGSEAIAGLSEREILALIRFADRDDSWRELTAYVAALLHAEAAIYIAQAQPELAVPRALHALQLLVECELAGDTLPEFAPPRAELIAMLGDYRLPARTRAALFQLFERDGAYDRAEDIFFDLLAETPTNPGLLGTGIAFYERLLAHDEAALLAGGLPRAEVLQSLAELRGR